MALDLQQAEQLVHARRDRQLLGPDLLDAAVGEQLRQPVLHRRPVRLHLELGPHLLPPEPRRRRRSAAARARPRASPRGCAPGRSRGPPCAARRSRTARGRGGDARLADAALARVEDRPRPLHPPQPTPSGAPTAVRYRFAAARARSASEPEPPTASRRLLSRLRILFALAARDRSRPPSPPAAAMTAMHRRRTQDPQQVLDQTFSPDNEIDSADLDVSLEIDDRGLRRRRRPASPPTSPGRSTAAARASPTSTSTADALGRGRRRQHRLRGRGDLDRRCRLRQLPGDRLRGSSSILLASSSRPLRERQQQGEDDRQRDAAD